MAAGPTAAFGRQGAAERMADSEVSDSEPTTRTLLRRVLDAEAPRTPRRRQSTRAGYERRCPAQGQPRDLAGGVSVPAGADAVWRRKLSLGELRSPRLSEPLPLPYLGRGPLCAPHRSGRQAAEGSQRGARWGGSAPGVKDARSECGFRPRSQTRPECGGICPPLFPGWPLLSNQAQESTAGAEGRQEPVRVLC